MLKRYNTPKRLRQLKLVEKICRYSIEKWRSRIKSLVERMAKLDDDLVELGKSFSQTECGAGTGLALSHVFGAMRQKAQLLRN